MVEADLLIAEEQHAMFGEGSFKIWNYKLVEGALEIAIADPRHNIGAAFCEVPGAIWGFGAQVIHGDLLYLLLLKQAFRPCDEGRCGCADGFVDRGLKLSP